MTAGSIRVFSLRADQRGNGPEPGESVVRVDRSGERIALACWCKPRSCHGDWIVWKVLESAH